MLVVTVLYVSEWLALKHNDDPSLSLFQAVGAITASAQTSAWTSPTARQSSSSVRGGWDRSGPFRSGACLRLLGTIRQFAFSPFLFFLSGRVQSDTGPFPERSFWTRNPTGDEFAVMSLIAIIHGARGTITYNITTLMATRAALYLILITTALAHIFYLRLQRYRPMDLPHHHLNQHRRLLHRHSRPSSIQHLPLRSGSPIHTSLHPVGHVSRRVMGDPTANAVCRRQRGR